MKDLSPKRTTFGRILSGLTNYKKTFADKENGEAYWRDFLAKAIAATLKAEQALENLEKYDEWYRGKRHRH